MACSRERLSFGSLPGEDGSGLVPSASSASATTSPVAGDPVPPDVNPTVTAPSEAPSELPDGTNTGPSTAEIAASDRSSTAQADTAQVDSESLESALPGASTSTSTVTSPTLIETCSDMPPPTSQTRFLTNTQYDRTIRDLLGVVQVAEFAGPPSSGLTVNPSGDSPDSTSAAAYQRVADAIAKDVIASETLRGNFIDCDSAAEGCLQNTVTTFGRRAYRRPLTATETAGFQALIDNAAEVTPTGAPLEVAEMLLSTFLVSPSFLMRTELGSEVDDAGRIRLTSHEVAQRLSYALWGSTPDPELSTAADQGELGTPEQLRAQAVRMLQDARAKDQAASFHERYIGADDLDWPNPNKDPKSFPNIVASSQTYRDELRLFFEDVVFGQQGGVADLFSSPVAYVNESLAPLYGLDDSSGYGDALERTRLDAAQRPGFLTRAGFLIATAGYDRTSPSLRGAEIARRVLGLMVDGTHAGAPMDLPSDSGLETVRLRVEIATSPTECRDCHVAFDALGFALETYDAVGRWQTMEVNGAIVDPAVTLQLDGVAIAVASSAELMAALANSKQVARVYAQSWAEFMLERKVTTFDGCYLSDVGSRLHEGGSILEAVADIAASDAFLVRTTP